MKTKKRKECLVGFTDKDFKLVWQYGYPIIISAIREDSFIRLIGETRDHVNALHLNGVVKVKLTIEEV